ncbi:uncharacterized protein [Antedon mediterranea]|uniref:uncharacterized protein n=1 Tax=Antedon mediterranea TaxID=105859 RepID=UPI003AF4A64C
MVTNNQYVLYYICAMHTYWFITVYVFMRVLSSWNTQPKLMAVKFVVYFICNTIIFNVPNVVDVVFTPFWPILSMNNTLCEWKYRAKLDHYVTLIGMISAYNYPNYERLMKYLDQKQKHIDRRDRIITIGIKIMSLGILGIIFVTWCYHFMFMERHMYNHYHPYISWFPILSYIFVRNLFPVFRTHHIGLFTWLGKITLETYITQFHIYMQYNAKQLIVFIDGYPLMNFFVLSVLYLFVSYHLFKLTTEFSTFLLPKNNKRVLYNFVGIILMFGTYFCIDRFSAS